MQMHTTSFSLLFYVLVFGHSGVELVCLCCSLWEIKELWNVCWIDHSKPPPRWIAYTMWLFFLRMLRESTVSGSWECRGYSLRNKILNMYRGQDYLVLPRFYLGVISQCPWASPSKLSAHGLVLQNRIPKNRIPKGYHAPMYCGLVFKSTEYRVHIWVTSLAIQQCRFQGFVQGQDGRVISLSKRLTIFPSHSPLLIICNAAVSNNKWAACNTTSNNISNLIAI